MFATLQVNPEKNSFDEVETGSGPGHSACVLCRAKKLKCTGQQNGCNRCVSKGLQCQYPAPSAKGSRSRNNASAKSKASTPPKTPRQQHSLAIEPAEPAEPFLFDEHLNFSDAAPYETDINMLSMENGMSADFWGDFNMNSTPSGLGVFNLPVPTGENSVNSDSQLEGNSSTRFSLSTNASDTDMSFLYPLDLPSITPSKSAGAEVTQTISPPTTEDHTTGGTSSANSPCQCYMAAVSLLESTGIQNISITRPSVSRILRHNKHTLARYKRLLTCEHCSAQSSFLTLLIVVSQNLVDAYEAVTQLLIQQFNEIHKGSLHVEPLSPRRSQGCQGSISNPRGELNDSPPQLNLQGYDFEEFEEPCVFGGIVHLHLTLLQSLLNRIRRILHSWNWDAHLTLVETVNTRIKELSALFVMNKEVFDQ